MDEGSPWGTRLGWPAYSAVEAEGASDVGGQVLGGRLTSGRGDASVEAGGRSVTGLLGARRWQLAIKRLVDVAGSVTLLLALAPVVLAVAVAIRTTSRGPVLWTHERIGRDGSVFKMYKFRSMRADAHEQRGDLEHLNEAHGPVFKIRNDPRITRVGRVIRKFSIDELPQLWNVLQGDMSLVGPRPPLPEEFATYGARERGRLVARPGLTCTWQVSGRSDIDFESWVEMDLEYIRRWTLREDLRLLLRTIPAVITGRGAY